MGKIPLTVIVVLSFVVLVCGFSMLIGCEGEKGPTGPAGDSGTAACGTCHDVST